MKRVRALRFVLGLAVCAAFGSVLPAGASAGSISGSVRDETPSHNGIAGVEVCPRPEPYEFETVCTETNASGAYRLDGLPAHSYHLYFSTYAHNLNYVRENYDDTHEFPGDLVALTSAGQELIGIDAELEEGGVIVGTATNAESPGPAVGVSVCATRHPPGEYFSECGVTGPDGKYEVNALPSGEYTVDFSGDNTANYLHQVYEDGSAPGFPTYLEVTSGSTVPGIDTSLYPGAQILGNVTETGTGAPLREIEVCLFDTVHSPSPEYVGPCAQTDVAGNYAIRSLPAGTYDVVFSQDHPGFIVSDYYYEQWYDGVGLVAQATKITIAPPASRTGINARLTGYPKDPPRGPDPIQVSLIPTPQPLPPKKCRKGFHKQRVKGKVRCVKKQRKHRGGGRRAGAR